MVMVEVVAGVGATVVIDIVPNLSNIGGLSLLIRSLYGPLPLILDSSSSGHIHGSHGPLHIVNI
ncbi:hypothetical protein A2U01_0091655 [Trifolium medium]|uniref:Uncharacterized protein n=1 Tax=Trifolium medium TaxID=97028 RepID=A0A392UAI1_9FABA|nr:hypothetical protein [Trifolium medium]